MVTRYFLNLAYNGSTFNGWQIQPNDPTIQGNIEAVLSQLYNHPINVSGCGRTDAGVHASDYYAHIDLPPSSIPIQNLRYKMNNMLPNTISIKGIEAVSDDAHARFDATSRSYIYKMVFGKDPFRIGGVYKYDQSGQPSLELMNEAAATLLQYEAFYPFCKSHADVQSYNCQLTKSEWLAISDKEWHFNITANRFLRGMVRLVVGMCINVGLGRIELSEVRKALDAQKRLDKAWAVPAHGLYLSAIKYPYI